MVGKYFMVLWACGCAASVPLELEDPGPPPAAAVAAWSAATLDGNGCSSVRVADGVATPRHCVEKISPAARDAVVWVAGEPGGLHWSPTPEDGSAAWSFGARCGVRRLRVAWAEPGYVAMLPWPDPGCRGDSGGPVLDAGGRLVGLISGMVELEEFGRLGLDAVRPLAVEPLE